MDFNKIDMVKFNILKVKHKVSNISTGIYYNGEIIESEDSIQIISRGTNIKVDDTGISIDMTENLKYMKQSDMLHDDVMISKISICLSRVANVGVIADMSHLGNGYIILQRKGIEKENENENNDKNKTNNNENTSVQNLSFLYNDLLEFSHNNAGGGKEFFTFKFKNNKALYIDKRSLYFCSLEKTNIKKIGGPFRFIENPLRETLIRNINLKELK